MYNSVIPDIDSSGNAGNDVSSNKVNGSISLFDIGERLEAGKGV